MAGISNPPTNTTPGSSASTAQTQVADMRNFFGIPTEKDCREKIFQALSPLGNLGVNLEQFSLAAVNQSGFTTHHFCKLARVLVSHAEADVIGEILVQAMRHGKCGPIKKLNLREFIDVCKWLKTSEGQKAVQVVYRIRKIKKKGPPGASASDIAWADILSRQLQELATKRKAARMDSELQIDELRFRISQLELKQIEYSESRRKAERMDFELQINKLRGRISKFELHREEAWAALNDEFAPASQFVDPTQEEVENEAYNMYYKEAVEKGIHPLPQNDLYIKLVLIERYCQKVRQYRMIQFCQHGNVREGLMAYLQEKILNLEAIYELKQANTLRIFLEVIDEKTVPLQAARQNAVDNESSPSGVVTTTVGNVQGEVIGEKMVPFQAARQNAIENESSSGGDATKIPGNAHDDDIEDVPVDANLELQTPATGKRKRKSGESLTQSLRTMATRKGKAAAGRKK